MTQTVLLFARLRELADAPMIHVDLAPGSSVEELRRRVTQDWPSLGELVARSAVALNGDYAENNALIRAGDDIALIPPVSGG